MHSKRLLLNAKFFIVLRLIFLGTTSTILRIPESGPVDKYILAFDTALVFCKISKHIDKYFDFIIGVVGLQTVCT